MATYIYIPTWQLEHPEVRSVAGYPRGLYYFFGGWC